MQPDTIIPNPYNPQSWNRYSYVGNNPIGYSDPTGHMRTNEDGSAKKGCTDPKYCEGGKPKIAERLKTNGKGGSYDVPYYSFDGGWNDPKYATWNLLRMGSGCTACHVTHDQPGDWGIPTNSGIDPDLVSYYRSNDKIAHSVHWAALSFVGMSTYLARDTLVIGHYAENPNYVQVANKIGASYFQVDTALTQEQVVMANENFIVNGVENGSRFVQSSFPVKPLSGLENEIGWLAENGYSSSADMTTEVLTSVFRTLSGFLGLSQDN